MRSRFGVSVSVFALALSFAVTRPSVSAAADCCSLNNGPCNIIASPGLVHGTAPWTGSVCGTTISGVNCHARLDTTDGTIGSGDCITLGAGVTLDLNGRTLTCDNSAQCGNAILNNASSGSGNRVAITNGKIRGCWQRGINFSSGSDATASEIDIDLDPDGVSSCTPALSAGLFLPRGTVEKITVRNSFAGIYASPGEDITGAVLRANYVGIANLGASSADVNLTNVQLIANGYGIQNANPGVYLPDALNVSIQDSIGTDCVDSTNATEAISDCLDFGTSTNPANSSFVQDTIYP